MKWTGGRAATAFFLALIALCSMAAAAQPTPSPAPLSEEAKAEMRQMLEVRLEGMEHGKAERGSTLLDGDLLTHALARAEEVRPDVPRPVQWEWAKGYMLTFDQKQAAFVLGLMIGGEDGEADVKAGMGVPSHDALDKKARARADDTFSFQPESWALFVLRYKAGYEVAYRKHEPAW